MKTNEQIKLAKSIISNLQDYIELAKSQSKLKVNETSKQVGTLINEIQNKVVNAVKDL